MRGLRLLALSAALAVALGVAAAGLLVAWLGAGPAAAPPTAAGRAGVPVALGSGAPPALGVHVDQPSPGSPALRIVVDNPNARAVSGVALNTTVAGGSCTWPEGPFPSPFGLAPAASTSRTCLVALDGPAPATVAVAVLLGGGAVATASAVVEPPGSPSPPAAGTGAGGGPAPAPPPAAAPPPPPCPRLVGAAPAAALDGAAVGPTMAELARRLDVAACPAWQPLAGLTAAPGPVAPSGCQGWQLWLPGRTAPVAALASDGAGCPAAPLQLEVVDQPTGTSALLAALAAWAVDGQADRATGWVEAARSGTGAPCRGPARVSIGPAYEQQAGDGWVYRVALGAC